MPLDRAEVLRSMELGGHGGDQSPGLAETAANGRERRGKQGGRSRSSQRSRRAAQEPRGGNKASVGSATISAGGGRRRDRWRRLEARPLESVGGGDQREEAELLDSLAGRNDGGGCGGSGRRRRPCSVAARESTEEGRALKGDRG